MRPRHRPPIKHSNATVHWIVAFMRQERVQQQLTQEALANTVGMPTSALGQYEVGQCTLPALRQLERILSALGYELRIHKKSAAAEMGKII